jgi:hypothetical protein
VPSSLVVPSTFGFRRTFWDGGKPWYHTACRAHRGRSESPRPPPRAAN